MPVKPLGTTFLQWTDNRYPFVPLVSDIDFLNRKTMKFFEVAQEEMESPYPNASFYCLYLRTTSVEAHTKRPGLIPNLTATSHITSLGYFNDLVFYRNDMTDAHIQFGTLELHTVFQNWAESLTLNLTKLNRTPLHLRDTYLFENLAALYSYMFPSVPVRHYVNQVTIDKDTYSYAHIPTKYVSDTQKSGLIMWKSGSPSDIWTAFVEHNRKRVPMYPIEDVVLTNMFNGTTITVTKQRARNHYSRHGHLWMALHKEV